MSRFMPTRLFATAVVIMVVCACSSLRSGEGEDADLTMGNASLEIPASEIAHLELEALRGSRDAAFRLYQHHEFVKLDYKAALYWVSIAAENGHPIGQYAFGFMLSDHARAEVLGRGTAEERVRDRERAVFWLKRSAENGNERALELLEEISAGSR